MSCVTSSITNIALPYSAAPAATCTTSSTSASAAGASFRSIPRRKTSKTGCVCRTYCDAVKLILAHPDKFDEIDTAERMLETAILSIRFYSNTSVKLLRQKYEFHFQSVNQAVTYLRWWISNRDLEYALFQEEQLDDIDDSFSDTRTMQIV
jgi:hypothetical protein